MTTPTTPNTPAAQPAVTAELLPCPFCGGSAKMIHPMGTWQSREVGYGPDGSRVVCSDDKCHGKRDFYGDAQDQQAVEAWNTRAIPASGQGAPVVGALSEEDRRRQQRVYDRDPIAFMGAHPAAPVAGAVPDEVRAAYERFIAMTGLAPTLPWDQQTYTNLVHGAIEFVGRTLAQPGAHPPPATLIPDADHSGGVNDMVAFGAIHPDAEPCKWGGGNDTMTCQTCGLEYDYRKQNRPACSHQGPSQASPSAEREALVCQNCGSSLTEEELAQKRMRHPALISCCPERKMVSALASPSPSAPGGWAEATEHAAKIVDVMVFKNTLGQDRPVGERMALAIAARAIRRGRHLTEQERRDNLFKALDELNVAPPATADSEGTP